MDRIIVAEKLESLRRCVRRIQEKTPADVESLTKDPDAQDILVLNLTRAIQLCVDTGSHIISASGEVAPATMGEVFPRLNELGAITAATAETMKKAVGFRNIAVHNYAAMDWEVVFAVGKKSPADFNRFAREISAAARPAE